MTKQINWIEIADPEQISPYMDKSILKSGLMLKSESGNTYIIGDLNELLGGCDCNGESLLFGISG